MAVFEAPAAVKELMGQHVEVYPQALCPELFPCDIFNIMIRCLVKLFPPNQPISYHQEKGKGSRNEFEIFWMKDPYARALVVVWCRLFLTLRGTVLA